jgi:hypothetical protein
VRAVESASEPAADFEKLMTHERSISRKLGGRTVLDDRKKGPCTGCQLRLF